MTYGAASYVWQFGDGTTAQTKVPLAFHRYAAAGTFPVTLIVTNAAGAQAQFSIQLAVAPLPAAEGLPTIAGPSARSRKAPAYSRVASKAAGASRSVFCWSAADWAILQPAFDEQGTGGFVDPAKPRQINLVPQTCSRLDRIEYRRPMPPPATSTAVAVLVFASGIEQSRGYVNLAQITCYGLQLVPDTSERLGATPAYADRLGRLAAGWYSRSNLPAGRWSPQCRDGGKLDLDPASKHWP